MAKPDGSALVNVCQAFSTLLFTLPVGKGKTEGLDVEADAWGLPVWG